MSNPGVMVKAVYLPAWAALYNARTLANTFYNPPLGNKSSVDYLGNWQEAG